MPEPLAPGEQPRSAPAAPPEERPASPREEIAALERLLATKRQSLAAEGTKQEERETFREAFRETYREAFTPSPASTPAPAPPPHLVAQADDLKSKERQEQLEALVAYAFSDGVRNAVELARHATPWLMDELHDTLQDRYYEELVQARRLPPLR